jgi:hypothetical protein
MKGSKAHLIIEQGKKQNYKPVLYIKAVPGTDLSLYEKELQAALKTITEKYPNISLQKIQNDTWEVNVPDNYHNGHEAHFGQVTENLLQCLEKGSLPSWEVPNMIAKYYVTTHALEIARGKR